MNNLEFMWNLKNVDFFIKIIESIFIIFFTFFYYIKIINAGIIRKKDIVIIIICSSAIAFIFRLIGYFIDVYLSWLLLILLITMVNNLKYHQELSYCFIITTISLGINYAIYMIALSLSFFPYVILKIQNDYIGVSIILGIYFLLINTFFNSKKIKHGIIFLHKKINNSYYYTAILNLSIIAIFLIVLIQKDVNAGTKKVWVNFIIVLFILCINIKQFFEIYYKQNLLTKDLEETKRELETKKNEIEKLERENLEFSKTSHSLAHKQKAIEFKLEQLMNRSIDKDSKEKIKKEIENLNQEVYNEPKKVELAETGIESIDNMLSYMQSECIKDNIKFELQVVGNIYYMINNLITENDLEILIADHIKDAIFAINFSDNSNRSILVRIGNIENFYSLYIYDSGIEFSKEVLDKLGKKPITTHAETGGTGMGFMNTFDTLNKTKASLIINEIGKPCVDNYTKVLIFKFDNKNEFRVNSYKNEIIV